MRSITFVLLLLLLCGPISASVYECRAEHGVRQFSDRPCADPIKAWSFPAEPPPTPPSKPERKRAEKAARQQRGRPDRSERMASFRCTAGARVWYQHERCSGAKGESVHSERVARKEACREISRPAASLRRGSERDGRATPYEKASGRDPC